MSFPIGLTDGMGTVVEEGDLDESFVNTVGASVESQYITPEGGGNYVPPAPEPAYDPWTDEQAYVPPAPDAGSTFFESDVGFTEYDGGPAYEPLPPPVPSGSEFFGDVGFNADGPGDSESWMPDTTYVTNEDYFGDLYSGLPELGAAPTPGLSVGMEGSGWFGDEAQQQQQYDWWNAEVNKAIQNGDEAKYTQLMTEWQQVEQGWADHTAAMAQWQPQYDAFGQQLGALDASVNQAFAFDPSGEGGFSRTPTGSFLNPATGAYENTGTMLQSDLATRAYMDQNGTPMVDTPYGPMHYTDAVRRFEQEAEAARNEAFGGQSRMFSGLDRADTMGVLPQLDDWRDVRLANNTFWTTPAFQGEHGDPFATGQHADYRDFAMSQENLRFNTSADPTFGLGGRLGDAFAGFGGADVVPGVSLREGLGGLWQAYNYGVHKAGVGFTYAAETPTYLTARLVGKEGGEGQPLPGESYVDFLRRQYNDQGDFQRMLNETVADPTNFLGLGAIGRGIDAATIAQKSTVIRRSVQESVDAGLVPKQLVDDFVGSKPSWRTYNELTYVADNITRTIAAQTAIAKDDVANYALGQRLVMEWHLAGQQSGDIAQTTQRVIADISWDIEKQYGKKAANQVVRQLTSPQVQQMAAVVSNPNAIPLPQGQIVVVEGNRMVGLYAPGSGRNLIGTGNRPTPLTGTSYQRTNLPAPTYTFAPGSGRNVLPNGLTRRNDGSIVTVSRKTAEDVLETAVRAETAVNDFGYSQGLDAVLRDFDAYTAGIATDIRATEQMIGRADQMAATVTDRTLPDPIITDLLPAAPARTTTGPIDATVQQLRWLDAFGQRDGVNYVDMIVLEGDTSRTAVQKFLQDIQGNGMATAAQWHEMARLGVPPSRRLEMIRQTRQQADAEIRRLARTQPRPETQMTWEQYKALYPETQTAPYSDSQVTRALKRGAAHGIDFLRRALDEGWSTTQFYDELNSSNMPATPAQRRTLEAMQTEGKIAKTVDLDTLTTSEADRLMNEAKRTSGVPSPVEAAVKYNVDAPLEVIDEVDAAADQAAAELVAAKKKAQDYLKRHIPQGTTTAWTPPGFKTGIKTQPDVDLGVKVMSHLAERQWVTDLVEAGTFKGTAFEPILEEMSTAIIHVGKDGLLSTGTVSARFDELNRMLIEMAGHAELDDTRRLIDALDNAYGNNRYRDITEAAGRRVKNLPADEMARRVDMARRQLPTIEADLSAIRRQLNDPNMSRGLTRQDKDRLRAERAKLEEQRDRALDLTNPNGHTAPPVETARSKRDAARQASSEKAQSLYPQLGNRPSPESPQSMAGAMSDHDIAHDLLTGRVPQTPQYDVVDVTQKRTYTVGEGRADALFDQHLDAARQIALNSTEVMTGGTTTTARATVLKPKMLREALGVTNEQAELLMAQLAEDFVLGPRNMVGQRKVLGSVKAEPFREMREQVQAFIEDMPDDVLFVNGVDDLPPNIQAMLEHTAARPFPGGSIAEFGRKLDDRLAQLENELVHDVGPNVGHGNFNFQTATEKQISDYIANLMSKHAKPGRPLPKWVRDEIRAAESQIGDTRPPGWGEAAGGMGYGGLGIVRSPRALPFLKMGKKVNTIEPNLSAWRNADWNAVGPHLDAYADEFYNVDWILDQDKRLKIGGKEINPTALQQSAKVALAGDFASAVFAKYTDEAQRAEDGYAYMRNLLESWVNNGSTDRIFQSSKHGAEALRLIRATGKDLLDDWDAILPTSEFQDIPRLADRMGTRISEAYARSIGYNPDDVPGQARMMMWVKSQLTPIWMTTVPTYHLNNIAGNAMAMLIESMRGRGHTNLFRGIVNGDLFDDPATGFNWGRWVDMDMSQFTEVAVAAAEKNAAGRHRPALLAIPGGVRKNRVRGEGKGSVWIEGEGRNSIRLIGNTASIIDWTTGGNLNRSIRGHKWKGLATAGEDFGNTMETAFKKMIFSQEVMGEYPKLWRAELDQMLKNGDLSPNQFDKLVMAKGLKQVREKAVEAGAEKYLDDLLARQRSVIFNAEHRAYTIAADAMRDYRMRNKIDGFLDAFLPVHFWSTKNMLYVTKAAMDRPALALSAGQAYNALAAEQKDSPLSIAQGYVKATADMIPWLPEGSEYYLRMTQLVNPVVFALPKLVRAMNRDIQNRPEDSSAWDMVKHWGKNGMANFWEASGYRLGPQWDIAIKIMNQTEALQKAGLPYADDIMFTANFLNVPYTDYEGKRRPGPGQPVLPFGGWESLLRKHGVPLIDTGIDKVKFPLVGSGVTFDAGMQWLNKLATGSPFTNYEVSQAALWMKEDTFVNYTGDRAKDEQLQIQLEEALAAMGSGNYDHPYIQQAMAKVIDNSAVGFLRGRLGMHAGKEVTVTNQKVDAAWAYYNAAKQDGREEAIGQWNIQYEMPAELRWIVRDSGAGITEIDKAMDAAREGKDHPLLKRAREATASEEWAMADQQEFGRMLFGLASMYDSLVVTYGVDYARDKMFGTWNNQTRTRDGNGIAPGMEALFLATNPEEMAIDATRNTANRNWNALRDMNRANQMDENHRARPYFDRIESANEALRSQVAKAGDNMRLVGLAYRSYNNITSRIYDEAMEKDGLDLGPTGVVPSQGKNYYTRTQEERQFLEWNGALEAVEGREREQARQAFVLNVIAEQLGVNKYFENGTLNTDFVTDGKFDKQKYDFALAVAADVAPGLFNQIVMDLRDLGSTIGMGVDGKGITADDFLHHMRPKNAELDAWRQQRNADRSAYYAMEFGPEKDAEKARLLREYGEEFLDPNYRPTGELAEGEMGPTLEGVTSPADHRRYNEATDAVAAWVSTLSPKDKNALKEQYPDAFGDKDGTFIDEDGDEVTYDKFHKDRLTAEQALEIVQSNGLDASLVRGDRADRVGQIRGEPDEMQRRLDADLTVQKRTEFYDIWTPEEEQVIEQNNLLKDDPLYAEAQALKEVSLSKAGNPNWYTAKRNAEKAGNTELAEFIGMLQESNEEVGPIYDKRDEWFHSQPDDVKAILIANDPATFGRYGSGDSAGTTVSGTGESSPQETSKKGGGSGWVDYPDRPKSGRPWVNYSSNRSSGRSYTPRGGGSSYRGGGSGFPAGGGAGSGDQPVLNQILSLDPFLATGEDDGRRAVAMQVSDHIQRMVSALSMFSPDKRMAQFFTGMWMQYIGRMLGPNPDMNSWMTLLARLRSGNQQPQQGPPAPAQPTLPPTQPSAPMIGAGRSPQQPVESLGGY